ncbi:MAG: ATP-binding protein [Thiohalobacteraceae bacterium]|nr:ATP-binding protein [Gammaproteobacteria bacterium]
MADERSWSVCVPAEASRLQALRALVREAATDLGFAVPAVEDLVLAVNEACMNVIQHGYRGAAGTLELQILPLAAGIEIRLRDHASPVSLQAWRGRDLRELRPGGLGVHFIRSIMDEIAYLPVPDATGNLLCMKKHCIAKAGDA